MGPFPKMVNSVNLKSFTILVKRSRFTFSFPRRPKKMLFPKKRLSCIIGKDVLSGKMIFLFPENMILSLRRKWEMIFLKKTPRKYDIFFKYSEKKVFSKGIALEYDLSCIIWKDGIFSRKHDIFFLDGKWEVILLKKYTEIWYFLCTRTAVTNVTPHSPAKKNQRWSYFAKIHLKVIGIPDWHSRKGSSNSLYFHRDLCRRFLILLSCKKPLKKQEP